jgi:ribonuclease R
MYRAYLMREQVGEEFEGTVSAVTSFGAFVEIDTPYVEGLIKLESLGDEPFSYDEVHMRLSGRKTGRSIELGDKVKVQINNVSVVRRRIDFLLLATAKSNKDRPVLTPNPRSGIAKQKKAGREVDRAQRGRAGRDDDRRGGKAARGSGGKLRLGVSHRGIATRGGDDDAPRGRGKPSGKPGKKRR